MVVLRELPVRSFIHAAATATAPAAAAASLENCSVCNGGGVAVWCNESHHPYCEACFDHTIRCQVLGEGRAPFISSGCGICCPICPLSQSPPCFIMHKCAAFLTEETFNGYQECLREAAVVAAQQAAEAQYESRLKAYQQQHLNPEDIEVAQFAEHIVDTLIRPRCPNKACALFIGDFDACAAIQCTCGVYFCAWCLIEIEAGEGKTARQRCHTHVREECRFNPHHNLFPPVPHPQIWEGVMHEWGRKRVKDFIQDSGGVWWMAVYDGVWR